MANRGGAVVVSVKGVAVQTTIEDIKRRRGAPGFEQVLADLDGPTSALLRSDIDPTAWYPVDALVQLMEANARRFDGGDESAMLRGSEKVIERQLKGSLNVFIKQGSPEQVIQKLALIHMAYFSGVVLECKTIAPGRAIIRYTGFHKSHRLIEVAIIAFYKKALELSGAKNVKAEFSTSIALGGESADLVVTWR
jgi:hypothetical protein